MSYQETTNRNPERLFYSVPEFASMFSLSPHTVRRDTQSGKIRTSLYGRRRLIPRAEVERITKILTEGDGC